MKLRRRDTEVFSLSFLDCICCGFGAIILLLVLTDVDQPVVIERATQAMNGQLLKLQQELYSLRGETDELHRELQGRITELRAQRATLVRLQTDLTDVKGEFATSNSDAQVSGIVENELVSAYQELTAEMERLQKQPRHRSAEPAVGGIPVDSVLAWPFLGEHPTRVQKIALGLCAAGLAILIYPLATTGVPFGIILALITGACWGAGTVYLKWARIEADPMGVASWQVTIAFIVTAAATLLFEGRLALGAAHTKALLATVFSGVVGNGIAYGLWFDIVRRLPAATASLGVLSVPVIGVIASVAILGEVPTAPDIVGFAMIFAASACVLLTRPTTAEATP